VGAAGGVKPLSVRELAVSAELIVVGKIVSLTSQWNEAGTQILTRVEVESEEVLKGATPSDRASFVQPGGHVGNVGSMVADAPPFAVGERVFLFLARRRDGQLGVLGLFQGKFTLERDVAAGVEMAVRRAPGSGQALDRIPREQLRAAVHTALGR
jgi:hypothetical protein